MVHTTSLLLSADATAQAPPFDQAVFVRSAQLLQAGFHPSMPAAVNQKDAIGCLSRLPAKAPSSQ
jgi:hypothetical protein